MGLFDALKRKATEFKENIKKDIERDKELKAIEKEALFEARKKEAANLCKEKAKVERQEKIKGIKAGYKHKNQGDIFSKSGEMSNYLLGNNKKSSKNPINELNKIL